MKKKTKILLTFLSCLFLSIGLFSFKNNINMYKKAVFPIIYNIDNAFAPTDLNGHIRGDSATGYEIWGRNFIGSEFPLMGGGGNYIQKELFTDQTNMSVGDSLGYTVGFLILKRINSPVAIKFSRISMMADLNAAGSTTLVSYILDRNKKVLNADTVLHTGASVGYFTYDFPLPDTIVLAANTTYFLGVYSHEANSNAFLGNKYNAIVSATNHDSTWVYFNSGVTNPKVGTTVTLTGLLARTINLRYYFK